MKVFKAPEKVVVPYKHCSIFLAGSIEMGKAVPWQDEVCEKMSDTNTVFLNPRRDDWDPSWVQRSSDPRFNEQVTWENDNLDKADIIIFYFDPKTISPISLLELGTYKNKHVFVHCDEEYFRYGNIEMFCERFKIPLFNNMDLMLNEVRKKITWLVG